MGYENSGEGDPAERFRPRHHPTHSSQPPQHKKPRCRCSSRAAELASNRVHAQRQAGRDRASGLALARSEATGSRGESAEGEQHLTRAHQMSQFALRELKYSARPCLRREESTQGCFGVAESRLASSSRSATSSSPTSGGSAWSTSTRSTPTAPGSGSLDPPAPAATCEH